MTKKEVIKKTKEHLRKEFENEGTGHDWWHIERVFNNATTIAKGEKCDLYIVQLGALMHDIADFKFHGGDETVGGKVTEEWLKSLGVDKGTIEKVRHIVDNVSFKGLGEKNKMESIEGKIVQDADRLDAIGAMGIARAFAYGGSKNRPLYNPEGKTAKHETFEDYKKNNSSTIHHFYEKLLHLKDLMNTKTGKKLALKRHKFLENYLNQFLNEWNGKA